MSTIYIDMDGVMADIYNGIRLELGLQLEDPHIYTSVDSLWTALWKDYSGGWDKFTRNNGPEFWATLPVIPNGLQIANELAEDYDCRILTSHHDGRCCFGKWSWLQHYLPDYVSNGHVIFCKEKWRLAKHGDVLIDDWEEQMNTWIQHGGIGILYKGESIHEVQVTLESLCLGGK